MLAIETVRHGLSLLECDKCGCPSLTLEYVPEDYAPGTYLLKCFACSKPILTIPRHSVLDWARRQKEPAVYLAVEDAQLGYLPAGYLLDCGFTVRRLERAAAGAISPFCLNFAVSPPLILEPPQ